MAYAAISAFLKVDGSVPDPRTPEEKARAVVDQAVREQRDLPQLLYDVLVISFKLEASVETSVDQMEIPFEPNANVEPRRDHRPKNIKRSE